MRRTLKYALSTVLSIAVVMPAIAQDNFPDVQENHWAYEALLRMKREGLLVGYPDGLFRGGRPATRYELAVAVHATYAHLKNLIDGLGRGETPTTGGVSQADFDALKRQVEQLRADLANVATGQNIEDLRKMAQTFERELAAMGVDVQQMKRDLADLQDRVTSLENRLPVDISGDLNFVALGGYGDEDFGGLPGITVDGRPTGVDRRSGLPGVGVDRDMSIMHEAALTLTSARRTGAKWKGTFVWSNMLDSSGSAFIDQSTIPFNSTVGVGISPGGPFREGDATVYVQNLSVAFDTSVYGAGLGVEVGRVGYKISPMIFQRPDNTPYYANDRWDNGEWNWDGAILGLGFGTAKVNIIGGRVVGGGATSSGPAVGIGSALQPMPGAGTVTGFTLGAGGTTEQFLGVHANLPLTDNGSINLAYLWLDSMAPTAAAEDRLDVFGGDLRFNFGSFMVDASYAQSNWVDGNDTTVDEDNRAFTVGVGYTAPRWGARVAWRQIEPLFAAPGDWGRIGTWWNPTDIRGVMASGHFDLTNDLRLTGKVESYTGVDDDSGAGGTNRFLNEDDQIMRYVLGVEYRLASNYDLALGVEEVRMDLDDLGAGSGGNNQVIERWYNIGFGWNIADNAKLKFLWQVSDYKALEAPTAFWPFGGFGFGDSAARGGLITAQLSVKY